MARISAALHVSHTLGARKAPRNLSRGLAALDLAVTTISFFLTLTQCVPSGGPTAYLEATDICSSIYLPEIMFLVSGCE